MMGSRAAAIKQPDRWPRRLHASVTFVTAKLPRLSNRRSFMRSCPPTAGAAGRVALLLAAVMLLAGCAADQPPPPAQPSFYRSMAQPDAELDAGVAASMISGYRANNGLGPVSVDADLTRLAQQHARTMAARNKMDHDVGGAFSERIRRSGYDAKVAVENISAGYHTLAEAFSGWRDSPPHRANMLNRGVTRIGIAAVYAPGSKYKVFWALILAAPDDKRG
jgi:uncharacterized protein YkwD